MKTFFTSAIAAVMLTLFTIQDAYAADKTDTHVVGRIQTNSAGTTYVRPLGLGKWGGTGCPLATYVVLHTTVPGYEQIMSLLMASKLNGSAMHFQGTCSSSNYFVLDYAFLK